MRGKKRKKKKKKKTGRGKGWCRGEIIINQEKKRDHHCVFLVSQDSVIFLAVTTAQGHDVNNVERLCLCSPECVCVSRDVYSAYLCGWQCVYAALKACACFIRFQGQVMKCSPQKNTGLTHTHTHTHTTPSYSHIQSHTKILSIHKLKCVLRVCL